MADSSLQLVKEALLSEKAAAEAQLSLLESMRPSVDRRSAVVDSLSRSLVVETKSLLSQFSGGSGYSEDELLSAAQTILESSLSNDAAADGIEQSGGAASREPAAAAVQEAANEFLASLTAVPLNAFVLPRVAFDNMASENVARANAINEAITAVGLTKLMHDVIPPAYYSSTALSTLQASKTQLVEVARNLALACGAVVANGDPADLVSTIENDFESVVRNIAREAVYDASQFSPTEYLAAIQRIRSAADVLERTASLLNTTKQNMLAFQTSFLAEFNNSVHECGSLSAVRSAVLAAVERIDALSSASPSQSEALAVSTSRDLTVQLTAALATLREHVRRNDALTSALTVDISEERTSFENAQTNMASLPDCSDTLHEDLRTFARLAERRLTTNEVLAQLAQKFADLQALLPGEYTLSLALQNVLNGFNINLALPDRSLVISSLQDLKDLNSDRLLSAILTGDLAVVFDTRSLRASSTFNAVQQVASSLENLLAGISLEVGDCRLADVIGQRRVSSMLSELQSKMHQRFYSKIGYRSFIDKQIRDLREKTLVRLQRHIAELDNMIDSCKS